MFSDTLMRRRVDLPALAPPPPPSTRAPITLDEEEIGTVWLERPGPPARLDDLVLDRLAIAAAAVLERYGPARTTMADPALVELAISAEADQAASARALRLLGFPADLPVAVAAVRSQLPLDQVGGLVCPARPVKAAPVAEVGVILATTLDPARFPPGVRAGIGAAERPDRSWQQARTALGFTTPRQPVVHYDSLGALALLAQVPRTPRATTPTWPRSPAWPATHKTWRPWTPTATPAPSAGPPSFSTCTTAAGGRAVGGRPGAVAAREQDLDGPQGPDRADEDGEQVERVPVLQWLAELQEERESRGGLSAS
jgi:hypothetical protein